MNLEIYLIREAKPMKPNDIKTLITSGTVILAVVLYLLFR